MNNDENIPHSQHTNNNNGNPPMGDVDPALENEIVEIVPRTYLSARMWDSFKTYMLYPFMIAVAGSFGLSIGTNLKICLVISILILFSSVRLRFIW